MSGDTVPARLLKNEKVNKKFLKNQMVNKRGFKDIVQPKKRGVERGPIRTVLTCYTIADIF
jgi:hypothetical protein